MLIVLKIWSLKLLATSGLVQAYANVVLLEVKSSIFNTAKHIARDKKDSY
jgi:hypothetical protein